MRKDGKIIIDEQKKKDGQFYKKHIEIMVNF